MPDTEDFSVQGLSQAIVQANEDAAIRCADIQDKDVVVFLGCTGSGKTTVCVYLQGGDFRFARNKLEACQATEGFEVSDARQSVTHGLASAVVPNTDGLRLVDMAGTGDTAGDQTEVCGGIYRSSVLQAARSIRVVLVMSLDRAEVSNDRGKHAMRDLEHIAGLFKNPSQHLRSIGLVVTNRPRFLTGDEPAANTIAAISEAFEKLHSSAFAAERDMHSGAQGAVDTGMRTTRGGLCVLEHFWQHCSSANEMLKTVREGEDDTVVARLLETNCAIYPVNVLSSGQRQTFQRWLANLQSVPNGDALTYSLPTECKASMEQVLSNACLKARHTVEDSGEAWAAEPIRIDEMIRLLELFVVLVESSLLPMASELQTDLTKCLLSQNQRAAGLLQEGVRFGNIPKVDSALQALSDQEAFRKRAPSLIKLAGWSRPEAAMHDSIEAAEQALARLFPEGLQGVKWDLRLATDVGGLLEAVQQFGKSGERLLKEWAEKLCDHVHDLKALAAECVDVDKVVQSLTQLSEYRHLWTDIVTLLGKHGCEELCGSGFDDHINDAKAQVKAQLKIMSKTMIEERQRGSNNRDTWDHLLKCCRSTELTTFLGEDLEHSLMMKPLSAALAPSQADIDTLCQIMSSAQEPDQWRCELNEMAHRVTSLGDLGPQILEAGGLNFEELIREVTRRTAESKKYLKEEIASLQSASFHRDCSVRKARSTMSDFSDNSGDASLVLTPDSTDNAVAFLETIVVLQIADPLLRLFERSASETAAMALESVGWSFKSALQRQTRSARSSRGPSWSLSSALSMELVSALKDLRSLNFLASRTLKIISEQDRPVSKDLVSSVESLLEDADSCIQAVVHSHLSDVKNASTEKDDWPEVFCNLFQTLNKLAYLSDDVQSAEKELYQKVASWRDECWTMARELAEDDEHWVQFVAVAVSKGMAFEESRLSELLKFEDTDRCHRLVDKVADRWRRDADVARQDDRLRMWQKLTTLLNALERLPREDARTKELCRHLTAARKPLDAALNDTESRIIKNIEEKRYADAARLLSKVQGSSKYREQLADTLIEDVEKASQQLHQDCEVDEMEHVAKVVRSILSNSKGLQELASPHVQEALDQLKKVLEKKQADAQNFLQQALEGKKPPSRELRICAALTGKSRLRMAEEALAKFTEEKKSSFPQMSRAELVTWVNHHDTALKHMPEELRFNDAAYQDLAKHFQRAFSVCFKKDIETMEKHQTEREWSDAKKLYQQLRDDIENLLKLDILKAGSTEIKNLKGRLGGGGKTRCSNAVEQVKQGEYYLAIWLLVTGDGSDAEGILLEAIIESLQHSMSNVAADDLALPHKLKAMESFLEAVGKQPPDELRSLSNQVCTLYNQTRAQAEARASAAVQNSLEVMAKGDLNITRLTRALLNSQTVDHLAPASIKQQLDKAVQEVSQRMERVIQKICADVYKQDEQSITLDLEPVKKWLHEESQLQSSERIILSQRLLGGVACLRDWTAKVISGPLTRLVDTGTIHDMLQACDFAGIRSRWTMSRKLHAVLGTPCLDLSLVKEYACQKKDLALRHLRCGSDLSKFNIEYKVLSSIQREFPEASSESAMGEVEGVLQEKVLEPKRQCILQSKSAHDAMQTILELRDVANQAPDVHDDVTRLLARALVDLEQHQSLSKKTFNALGAMLGQSTAGQIVIAEHPQVFSAARDFQTNARIRRAGQTHDVDTVVGRLTKDSRLCGVENRELKTMLDAHEEHIQLLIFGYLRGEDQEKVLRQVKDDLDIVVAACTKRDADGPRKLLTHLAACFTVSKCTKEQIESQTYEPEDLFLPHRTQMLTLFRLLRVHKQPAAPDSFWTWFVNLGQRTRGSKFTLDNHLAQVLTGEGKCLTLGLLASFLALLGIESDIACYHEILTIQDRAAMDPFYKFVGVTDKVQYVTFDQLCGERLERIKKGVTELLEKGTVSHTRKARELSSRALLVDEVDVLFGRLFGNVWEGGFSLKSQEASAMIRYIFKEKKDGHRIANITGTDEFKDLLKSTPTEMHRALRGAAMVLVQSIENWSQPEPIFDEKTGLIGYKEKHEVNYKLAHANKTVFAYLNLEMEGKITAQQAEQHLGIDLCCGRFSFADLPKQYLCTLGVSGTVKDLLDIKGVWDTLQKEYSFTHFTYAPSIYGDRNLVFKAAEHVSVHDDEPNWISAIESEVESQSKQRNSILIFFKNEAELKKFPGWANFEFLTERTDPKRRAGYIAAATIEGRKTLATRTFGRGIDFQMPDGHEVVVLLTFLPSMISELTQIKGRTARQGKSGQFRLKLCSPHLQAKMGFTEADIQTLKSGGGDSIEKLLTQKQRAKTESKLAGMKERKAKAASLERDTKAWEEMLFNTDIASEIKLKKLAEYNGNEVFQEVHYTLMLDISGSMSGTPWSQLTTAFRSFKAELLRDKAAAAAMKVTVILFNHAASSVLPTHARAEEVQDISHRVVGGGTSFQAAFEECHKVIGRSAPLAKEVILFFTDGMGGAADPAIKQLLSDHQGRIQSLTCIGFGAGAGKQPLEHIGELFKASGVGFQLAMPGDESSLVQTFTEAASSRAIHNA